MKFAAVAPHGEIAGELEDAMRELGRRFPGGTLVVVTPHNVHVEGHFAVVTSARIGEHAGDRALALALIDEIRGAGLPVVGVSYGGNDPSEAELPLDWGTGVPLEWIAAEHVVVVAPARDRPLDEHIRLGAAIARRADALLASADHAHAHREDGPYGFHPAAAEYDRRFQELAAGGDFRPLAELVEDAKADSLWQLLVLQGATGGRPFELLAYAAPSYYGMAVAIAVAAGEGARSDRAN
jgi:aromatic ring-opening dioxygenase LigB subunit